MKSKLRKLLNEKKFVFTAETSPPDSGNKDVVIDEVECLNGLADAINVTDGAGAKSHMSALATAAILAQNGIKSKKSRRRRCQVYHFQTITNHG